MKRVAQLVVVAATVAGCSSSPVDVQGTYSITVTNGANGCGLSNWNQGDSTANIPVVLTQSGSTAMATITGLTGDFVKLALGSATFTGSVDGDAVNLTLFGTVNQTMGNCAYTYKATLEGELDSDTLTGTLTYSPTTNGSPDCASIASCTSVQDFNGTRPPP